MYSLRVEHILHMAPERTNDFNCWGATLFLARRTPHLGWVTYDEVSIFLTQECHPIHRKEVTAGDMVGLFQGRPKDDNMRLLHTAYCVEPRQWVHKIGQNVATITTLNNVLKQYPMSDGFVFFRRNQCVSEI